MNEDLIERIDDEIDLLRRMVIPAFRGQIELLRDCRAEIERLEAENVSLRSQNEGLDDECAQLESELAKAKEYVPMTNDELGALQLVLLDPNEAWAYEAMLEAEIIKRAGLHMKERNNG